MGVIHKLREDIVSFIITLKKNNPSLGVRQLATLTSEQFHVQVSKSSVNSVLKKAALSSAVGRRPGFSDCSEKFSIPSAKKDQISKNMKAAGFLKEDSPEGRAEIHVPVEKEPIVERLEPKEEKPSFEPETVTAQVEIVRRRREGNSSPISDGGGFVFLKAAQWDVSQKSVMAELFMKYVRPTVPEHLDSVSDLFLFLKFLGEESEERLPAYKEHGFWVLNDFGRSGDREKETLPELKKLFEWEKTLRDTQALTNLGMDYARLKDQTFLEVKGFKLSLEDGSELSMDASMISFGGGGLIPLNSYSSLPIHKAMSQLSNCLISNIQSAIFHRAPGEVRCDRALYDMAAVFENISGKRILRVSVVDWKDEEIAGFSTIPFQRRSFFVGIGPNQQEFAELTKAGKWLAKKPFYHAGTDKVVYFAETKTGLMATQVNESVGDFRVVTVWKDMESAPCWMILTNQSKGDGEDVLKAYMSQWPYLGESWQEGAVFGPSPDLQEKEGEKNAGIFVDFIEALNGYCQKHFFPPAYSGIDIDRLITSIYGVPGIFWEEEGSIRVFLDAKKTTTVSLSDLEYAVKRVNECHIFDCSGRRLWLEI